MADNKFFNLFNDIDEKYIKEAQLPKDGLDMYPDYSARPVKRRAIPLAIMGAAACAALVFGVIKLNGIVGGINHGDSMISSSGFSTGESSCIIFGTPVPASELEEFNYEELLADYRRELALNDFPSDTLGLENAKLTEQYYRARMLADMTVRTDLMQLIISDKVKKKADRAYAEVGELSQTIVGQLPRYKLYETGYSFDSFCKAVRDVFCKDAADRLIAFSDFYNIDGQLYARLDRIEYVTDPIVHVDYNIKENRDDRVVFNSILSYAGYDDEFTVMVNANRFVKIDGVWKAEELCCCDGSSVLGETYESVYDEAPGEFDIDGVPISEEELPDFDCETVLAGYRAQLEKDEGLAGLLENIGDPEFTDLYYTARTLADLTALDSKMELPESFARLAFDTPYNGMQIVYREMGYKYDSFVNTLNAVFCESSVDHMLGYGNLNNLYNYNNGIFYRIDPHLENPFLVHSDYELVTHTDDIILFNTIGYHIKAEYYNSFEENKFDPSRKDEYEITTVANLFIKADGKWKAEEICMFGDQSSIGGNSDIKAYTDDRGNTFKITGTPLSDSGLSDFSYEETLEYCRGMYSEDEQLAELLDGLGKPEVTELYYRARTLADIAAMRAGVGYETFAGNSGGHSPAQITMLKDTPPSFYSTIDPSYTERQIFRETGFKYDSFKNALNDVFVEESAAWLLARYPFFYGYDGQLYCNRVTAGTPMNCVHTEYELVENSADTVKFTTVNYYIPFESFWEGAVFVPENKDGYLTSEINNEFRYIDGEWKAYEVCMLVDCSSREGKMFHETVSHTSD